MQRLLGPGRGQRTTVSLQQALPGEIFDLAAVQVAFEVLQVAPGKSSTERAVFEAHVQEVDEAEPAFGQPQDVAQV
ncbi:hypothetical protein D9M68_492480 [compost metagenome]